VTPYDTPPVSKVSALRSNRENVSKGNTAQANQVCVLQIPFIKQVDVAGRRCD